MTKLEPAARPNGTRPVRGSAQRIQTKTARAARGKVGKHEDWQAEAYEYADEIPLIKQVLYYRGNSMSKLRLFPAVRPIDDPEGTPLPLTDPESGVGSDLAARAQAELARIKGPRGGASEILRLLDMNNETAGESWIVGLGPRSRVEKDPQTGEPVEVLTLESWDVRSVLEVKKENDVWKVRDPDTNEWVTLALIDDGGTDVLVRIWQRHPAHINRADCHMRALLGECESLVLLTNEVKAESKSRQNNNLLFIPNTLTVSVPTRTEPAGQDDDEDDESTLDDIDDYPSPVDEAQVATIAEALAESMLDPIEDPGSPWSVEPRIITGPPEDGAHIRYIELNRKASEQLEARIEARKMTIAQGMNAPVEVATGLMSTTFANAERVSHDVYERHLQPSAVLFCDMWTVGLLQPALLDAGVAPELAERIIVWFDPVDLLPQVDPAEHVKEALDAQIIGKEAGRRYWGFSEDDAPADDEFPPEVNPFGMPQDNVAPLPIAASAKPTLRSLGPRLAAGDRNLLTKTLLVTNAAMTRAIERAGNRLKARPGPTREQLRTVNPLYAAQTLGVAQLAAAGVDDTELLDPDAFDAAVGQFRTWTSHWQATALALAADAAALSATQRRQIADAQAQHLDDAADWMHAELSALAAERLFLPDVREPARGEFDPTSRIPAGLVRTGLAIAGGATALEFVRDRAKYVATAEGRPVGGVGTGPLLTTAISEAPTVTVEGYQWDYGDGYRLHEYEPHRDLNGETAESAVDFPATDFDDYAYPGDHDGCLCGPLIPVYAEVSVTEGPAPVEAEMFGGE